MAKVLTNTASEVLNAIKNSSTVYYKEHVPYCQPNAQSIMQVGNIIMDDPLLLNEAVPTLVNRIGLVLVNKKIINNPWGRFKKGTLDYGSTIEDIFVNIASGASFDPVKAESEVFKRKAPDVRSQFFVVNYRKVYKNTIEYAQLKQSFLSESGIIDLIEKITSSLVDGEAFDEFLVMKYMLARQILDGKLKVVEVPAISTANAKAIVSKIKEVSNKMTFPNSDYNLAGVITKDEKTAQFLIDSSDFDAIASVEVMASAFNLDKAEFSGINMLVDGFGELDLARLEGLLGADYVEMTADELEALNAIPAVLVSDDFFMIYDQFRSMETIRNPEGLYYNTFLHAWKVFATSAFAQACVFVPTTPSVTSVTVTPATLTAPQGSTITLQAEVVTAGFASKALKWTSNTEGVTVSDSGIVSIAGTVADNTTATITAKSVFDNTKYDTCVITVGSGE